MKDEENKHPLRPEDAAESELSELPCWASHVTDDYGNVACKKCNKSQSPHWKSCIHCCDHSDLEFDEDWHHGWNLTVVCSKCGKNHDFSNELLMSKYKAVLK